MKKRLKILIMMIIPTLLILTIWVVPYSIDRSWGEKGQLKLEMSIDKTIFNPNETVYIYYTLRNTGSTDLRILYPIGPWFRIMDVNGSEAVPLVPPLPPPPPATDKDLKILKAGDDVTFKYDVTKTWKVMPGHNYTTIGHYLSDNHPKITLPHWKGELVSNEIRFQVVS
ncbi:MAG: hypothetical protein AB1779_06875 [Candidatus Thermoplasmatota archaeon]